MQLDLNRPEAMAALKKLLGTADAFVTNLRQPALESQGLDYDTLSKEFPGLVYAHFTAWGRDGPKKDDPGYDVGAFWAATGLQFYARASEDDDLPRFVGGIGDYSAPTLAPPPTQPAAVAVGSFLPRPRHGRHLGAFPPRADGQGHAG